MAYVSKATHYAVVSFTDRTVPYEVPADPAEPTFEPPGLISSCMVDPYTGDLWWTLDNEAAGNSLFVARRADGYKAPLKPYTVTNTQAGPFGYEVRLIGFRSDMVIVSVTDASGQWDGGQWGTYLLAFSKDFSTYTDTLRPAGRQKILLGNDRLTPAWGADGTLYLLCDVRTTDSTPPYGSAKVKLFTWVPPVTLPNGVPVGGLPPLMTGTLTDITPTTGWTTLVEAGVGSDPAQSLAPRLAYRAADHSLLIATAQTRPTLPLVTPSTTGTKALSKTNFTKLALASGTVTALTRNDGRRDAGGTPTEAADSPYAVVEWAATDFERTRHYSASAPTRTWTLVHVAEPAAGTYREGFGDGSNTPTHYLLEQRSLADWSLIQRIDLRDVLADLPEAAGLSLDDLATWRLGSGWAGDPATSEHVYRLTWDAVDHALYVRYGEGSTALSGTTAVQGNERLLKLSVMPCPPAWVTPAGSLADADEGTAVAVTVQAVDPLDRVVSYSLKVGALPVGLSLDSATGAITGTAGDVAADTVAAFTLRAWTEGGSVDREFSITIRAVSQCTPLYDVATLGTLPAEQLAHAAANEAGTAVPPEWYAYPEQHAVNRVTRKIYIPLQEYTAASNGESYGWRFVVVDMDTGERTYLNPFRSE